MVMMAFLAPSALPLSLAVRSPCASRRPSPIVALSPPALAGRAAAAAAAAALIASSGLGVPAADASILSFPGTRPTEIGVRSERYLGSCAAGSKNCISSLDDVYSKTYGAFFKGVGGGAGFRAC